MKEGKTLEAANDAVKEQIDILLSNGITEDELQKAKNKIEAMIAFEDMSILSRANNLAFYELLGDAALINEELNQYQQVSSDSLVTTAKNIFRNENENTLFYKANLAAKN